MKAESMGWKYGIRRQRRITSKVKCLLTFVALAAPNFYSIFPSLELARKGAL